MIEKFSEAYTQVRLSMSNQLFKPKPRNLELLLGLLYVTNVIEIQLSFLLSTQDFQKPRPMV